MKKFSLISAAIHVGIAVLVASFVIDAIDSHAWASSITKTLSSVLTR